MMSLGLVVEEAADGEAISHDAMEELALEHGVDTSHLYAAAAVTTDVELAREHDVMFVACGGICQNWGALECIEHLCDLRRQRMDSGKSAFDIQARSCLDKCEHAPAVMVVTPSGTALIPGATRAALTDAVEQACE